MSGKQYNDLPPWAMLLMVLVTMVIVWYLILFHFKDTCPEESVAEGFKQEILNLPHVGSNPSRLASFNFNQQKENVI